MVGFSVDIDDSVIVDLNDLSQEFPNIEEEFVSNLADELWRNIVTFSQETKRSWGELSGSFQVESNGLTAHVFTNLNWARFVNDGYGPHRIEAHGKALKFEIDGETVYAKYVNHPGFEGLHFVEDSISETELRIDDVFNNTVKPYTSLF